MTRHELIRLIDDCRTHYLIALTEHEQLEWLAQMRRYLDILIADYERGRSV
jgi:hypothetical protein